MKKNPWPVAIIGSLVGILVIQVVVVWVATSNLPVMESAQANGYQSSKTWDREQAAFADARALGWRLKVEVGADHLDYALSHAGAPVVGLTGHAIVVRADGATPDRKVDVVETNPGRYRISRSGSPAGRYRVRAELTRGEERWVDERWMVVQ